LTDGLDDADLVRAFGVMATVRAFETAVARAFRAGEIPGVVHVSLGQEAIAGAIAVATEPDDALFSTHRGHGHCLARGVPLESLWAELLGRAAGLSGGRGGSMHAFSPRHGVMGTNGIVGANLPLAVGHALSAKLGVRRGVTLVLFGEGAAATGAFHEAVQLASLWRAPVVFVCENNGFAEFTSFERWTTFESVSALGERYRGLRVEQCDGRDLASTVPALRAAVAAAGDGEPTLLEAFTSRGSGHYEGDAQLYRAVEPDHPDPLTPARSVLARRGHDVDSVVAHAEADVEAARQAALALAEPDPATLVDHVYA
jgi:TPP-dependent pyruvate/acetoin dehydrogenase alpha subunit